MRCEAVRNKLCAAVVAALFVILGTPCASAQVNSLPADLQTKSKAEAPPVASDAKVSPAQPSNQPAQSSKANVTEKASKGKTHVRLGTVTVGASFVHVPDGFLAGPFWGYDFYPYGFGYDPFFYEAFPYSSFYEPNSPGVAYGPDKGEIRLEAKPRTASVFLNDAYAGTAGKLKHIWLAPGAYDLTVIAADGSEFRQRIYVLSGKSVNIRAKFAVPNE